MVLLAKDKGKITNRNYQKLNNISKRTATIDLKELAGKFKVAVSKVSFSVIPTKVGIHKFVLAVDSRLHGNDNFEIYGIYETISSGASVSYKIIGQ